MKFFLQSLFTKHESLLKTLGQGVFYRLVVIGVNFISGILISRNIGDANRGIFTLFLTSLMLLNIFLSFGINTNAAYFANQDKSRLQKYFNLYLAINFFGVILISLVLILFSRQFNFQSSTLSVSFIICYALFSMSNMLKSCLVGIHQNNYIQKLDASLRILYLIFILTSVYLNVLSVLLISIFFIIEYLVTCVMTYQKIGFSKFHFHFDLRIFRESLRFNSKTYIIGILLFLITRSDQYMIKYFMHNAPLGHYGTCNAIIENLGVIGLMILTIFLPKFLEIEDLNLKLKKAQKLILIIFAINAFIAIVIYFLSPIILNLYKISNSEALSSLRILLFGFVFYSLYSILTTVSYTLRYKKSNIAILVFAILLNISLNWIYIPKHGIKAAAWSSTLCYTLLFLLSYIDIFYFKKKNQRQRLQRNGIEYE